MIVVGLLLLTEILVECSSAETTPCNEKYLRMSSEHTMCKVRNEKCDVYNSGVTEEDKIIILATHNAYRNKVATGQEDRAGGMPKAANMLEMVWDEELALEAQKHAEQCNYTRDCIACRSLEEFQVGQNIGEELLTQHTTETAKNWHAMVEAFYDHGQFNYFRKSVIDFYFPNVDPVEQFKDMTQVIWAKTWRIGCGWVLSHGGAYDNSFYVCNYGPEGNVLGEKVYEAGEPCSKCPKNTCCGDNCRELGIENEYSGLCKIIDETLAPQEDQAPDSNYIIFCSFNDESDCSRNDTGIHHNFELLKTVGGNWIRLLLHGGEKSSFVMNKSFKSDDDENFCFNMVVRAANSAGTGPSGFSSTINFLSFDETAASYELKPSNSGFTFSGYKLDIQLPRGDENKVSVEFSVPCALPAQIIDVKELSVRKGNCSDY